VYYSRAPGQILCYIILYVLYILSLVCANQFMFDFHPFALIKQLVYSTIPCVNRCMSIHLRTWHPPNVRAFKTVDLPAPTFSPQARLGYRTMEGTLFRWIFGPGVLALSALSSSSLFLLCHHFIGRWFLYSHKKYNI
jgi:hypothetical protein